MADLNLPYVFGLIVNNFVQFPTRHFVKCKSKVTETTESFPLGGVKLCSYGENIFPRFRLSTRDISVDG